jgi:hypothetical protein
VGVRETGADLGHDADDAFGAEALVAIEQGTKAGAVEVLHHEIEQSVGLLTEVEDACDVGVIEPARREGFGVEAATEVGVGLEGVVKDLHRDGHLELAMTRPEDRAHPAATDERLDLELAASEATSEEVRGRRDALGAAFEIGRMPLGELVVRLVPCAERGRALLPLRAKEDGRVLLAHAQPEREPVGGRRSDGIGEEVERLLGAGGVHLEGMRRAVDGRRKQRDVRDLLGEGDALEEVPGCLVRKVGDEKGERAGRRRGLHEQPSRYCKALPCQRRLSAIACVFAGFSSRVSSRVGGVVGRSPSLELKGTKARRKPIDGAIPWRAARRSVALTVLVHLASP